MVENKFEDANLSSKKKNLISSLIDLFLLSIVSLLSYFLIGNPIASSSKENKEYNDHLSQISDFEHNLGIFLFDENDEKLDSSYISQVYIYNMITNTYLYENREMVVNDTKVELKEENSLGYIKDGKYVNDFLANYYLEHRETSDIKPNLANPYGDKDNKYIYFYMDVLSFKQLRGYLNSNVLDETNKYLGNESIINYGSASKMLDYLDKGNTDSEGYEIFQKFHLAFTETYKKTIDEISNNSTHYKNLCNTLLYLEGLVYGLHMASFTICFLISGILVYSLLPLILSKGKTIGHLITNTYLVNENSEPINRFKGFCHGLLTILSNLIFYGLFILFYFSYAINNSLRIYHFPLQIVVVVSVAISIVSLLMMLLSSNNQFLEDKICKTSSSDSLD